MILLCGKLLSDYLNYKAWAHRPVTLAPVEHECYMKFTIGLQPVVRQLASSDENTRVDRKELGSVCALHMRAARRQTRQFVGLLTFAKSLARPRCRYGTQGVLVLPGLSWGLPTGLCARPGAWPPVKPVPWCDPS